MARSKAKHMNPFEMDPLAVLAGSMTLGLIAGILVGFFIGRKK
jgi:hypothetical protein